MFHDRVFFPPGVNMYVPAMTGSADFALNAPVPFDFGKPALSAAANLMTGILLNNANGVEQLQTLNYVSDAPYGRILGVTPSGVPGGAGMTVRLLGWDYLGQPVCEDFVIGAAVSTQVLGKKAFMRLWKSRIIATSTNAVTGTVGTGPKLGLPYKSIVEWVKEDGVLINRFEVSAGKIVYPDTTNPATSITGDPRGTYECAQTLNGVRTLVVALYPDVAVDALGAGGLHGIRQFSA